MNKDKDYENDYRERGLHDNSSTGPDAREPGSAATGQPSENTRKEDTGTLGAEPARRTEATGDNRVSRPVLETDYAAGERTGSTDRGTADARNERTGDPRAAGDQYKSGNFRLKQVSDLGTGGPKAKFRDNVAAIELLKKLERESRPASSTEQAVLARYVGWGGLPQAFDQNNDNWAEEYQQLQSLLTDEQYESARASTLNAHYTSVDVISGIYDGLGRLGVGAGDERLRVLEPASGTGHFAGLHPFSHVEMTLNELEPLSAAISRHLYPDFTTVHGGFEHFQSPENYFDVAVGNPPFGNYRLNDPLNPGASRFSIHNFFMAKSLDAVRPGGITAMVVSRHFLDSKTRDAREYIADRAHFLGAIRLPNNAFSENALTTVTTDIVFLQRAQPGEETERDWVYTDSVLDRASNERYEMNRYYLKHPEQLIGNMRMESRAHGYVPECYASDNINLREEINARFSVLPAKIFKPENREEVKSSLPEIDFSETNIKVDSFFVTPDDRLAIRRPDMMGKGDYELYTPRSATEEGRIRSAVVLRDTLLKLIELETNDGDEQEMATVRRELNVLYDTHIKKYDYLSSRSNKSVLKYDPMYPFLQSLEMDYDKGVTKTVAEKEGTAVRKPSAKKAAIFSRRVNQPKTRTQNADSSKDGLVISLNEYGRVDVPFIAKITRNDPYKVTQDLKGLIFLNPQTLDYETADHYLTGDVKKKLNVARQITDALTSPSAANRQILETLITADDKTALHELTASSFTDNIEALEKVQPADIDAVDISVQLMSTWLPSADIKTFIQEHLGIATQECKAHFEPSLGKWVTSFSGGNQDLLHSRWGTERISATSILEKMFANTPVQVTDVSGFKENGDPIYVVNQEETLAAQGKVEEISNEFRDWIWKDPERRTRLSRLYNDRFNTHVPGQYDGSHLTLPAASGDVRLRGTQKNAVWRSIQEGGGLLDHVVGAGKTLTAIATIMEQRRMGLLQKPLVVVPNHLLGQWKDETYKLYPGANVLVAEKSDFEKDNRKRLFGMIATGDWDAVIIGHSSFKFLALSPEDETAFLKQQVKDINDSLYKLEKTVNKRDPSIKEIEKQKKRLEQKIEKISGNGRKDDLLTFDQLGVDALFVDEADEFKNLAIVTSQSRIAGLGNLQGSEKAMDLFLKCRWLQDKRDGKGVYFLTGTPISNSIAELYTMQRYLQYPLLKEKGILSFDSWSSTFGEIISGWELDATGVNYRLNSRFAKFTNVPELIRMYRSFADVVTQQDLAEQARQDGTGRLVPKIKGGKPTSVIVPRSKLQARFMGEQETVIDASTGRPVYDASGKVVKDWNPGSIIWRMENMPKDSRVDNALKVTHDARIAALDFRLVDPHAPDDPQSKVNFAADNIFRNWQENTYRRGTQLVFCDLSTPKRRFTMENETPLTRDSESDDNDAGMSMDEILGNSINPDTFSVYEDLKQKLIAKGIPANEIRFIHEATNDQKRAELFRAVNNGDVRVLVGSTFKMGAGTNVQRRLTALHDLDCPWRPRDLEQRHGRILRQGNMFFEQDKENFEVEIFAYATERTYDARMWQTIEVKARAIEQFRNGSLTERVIEDVAGEAANAAEMKASATGNELIFQQVKIDAEKRKQETLYKNWQRSQHSLQTRLDRLPDIIKKEELRLSKASEQRQYITQHADSEGLRLHTGDTLYWKKSETLKKVPEKAVENLEAHIVSSVRESAKHVMPPKPVEIGVYRGMQLSVCVERNWKDEVQTRFILAREDGGVTDLSRPERLTYSATDTLSVTGLFSRIDNVLTDSKDLENDIKQRIARLQNDREIALNNLTDEYPQKAYLDALRQDAIAVMAELKLMQENEEYKSSWKPSSESLAITETPAAPEALAETLHKDRIVTADTPASPVESEVAELPLSAPVPAPEANTEILSEDEVAVASPEGESRYVEAQDKPVQTSLIDDVPASNNTLNVEENTGFKTCSFAYGRVIYNTEKDRLQVKFNEKPQPGSEEHHLMLALKQQGHFRFAPTQDNSWVRRLNDKAVVSAANILKTELPLVSVLQPDDPLNVIPDVPAVSVPVDVSSMEARLNEMFSLYNEGKTDPQTLFKCARQTHEAGSAEGAYLLSFCYFDGIGVKADNKKAFKLLHKAANSGHQEACYKTGELYETGEFEHPVDLKAALTFYEKADVGVGLPAIERVTDLIAGQRVSEVSGLRSILDMNQQEDTPEKFFSRMNLLYERIILAQSERDSYKAELKVIASADHNIFCTGETNYLLDDSTGLVSLNRHIMNAIKDAVQEHKTSGLTTEIDVGQFAGLRVGVRASEGEIRFALNGASVWTPDELVYRKGERDKFRLPEFLDALERFPMHIEKELKRVDEQLAMLDYQHENEHEMFRNQQQQASQAVSKDLSTAQRSDQTSPSHTLRHH